MHHYIFFIYVYFLYIYEPYTFWRKKYPYIKLKRSVILVLCLTYYTYYIFKKMHEVPINTTILCSK